MIWSTRVIGEDSAPADPLAAGDDSTSWPVHEVGREADFFDAKSARLLKAGSSIVSDSVHLHSNGRDTTAHLEVAFKFMPKGYKPDYKRATYALGNGVATFWEPGVYVLRSRADDGALTGDGHVTVTVTP